MSHELAKRHAQEIRQRREETRRLAEIKVVRDRLLDSMLTAFWQNLEKDAEAWVDGINEEFEGENAKLVEFLPGDGTTVPIPGFAIRRGSYPAVYIAVTVDVPGRLICIESQMTPSHEIPTTRSQTHIALDLDDKDSLVTVHSGIQSGKPLSELLDFIVRPVVKALSE